MSEDEEIPEGPDGETAKQKNAPAEKLSKPWEDEPPTATECIELLEKRSYIESSRQNRLVELGDRSEPYEPAMREAFVFATLANRLRAFQIKEKQKREWRDRDAASR